MKRVLLCSLLVSMSFLTTLFAGTEPTNNPTPNPFFATQTLSPTEDAFLQGSTRYNLDLIRLEQGYRTGYLKFDLSGISGTITNVELKLTIYSDTGAGSIDVYHGSTDSWTETTLTTSNAPAEDGLLATRADASGTGTHSYLLSMSNSSIYSGSLSVILKHTGTNDLAYASKENATASIRPELVVTYTTGGDTTNPTAPSLSSSNVTETSVDLSWSGASDNIGVTGYRVYQDGTQIASPSATTYQVTGLIASTAYAYVVTALDAAGNESVNSNTENITTSAPSGGGGGTANWTESGSDIYFTGGNVGIGTSTPDQKLAVNGKIRSKEILVEIANWPDYVFESNYPLPSLEEVADFIEAHGHLQGIPSATTVETQGAQLGEMNRLLLEKIEELTLYLLELHQKNLELKAALETLKSQGK